MSPATVAELGVIGGSGLYAFLDDVEQHAVQTPYGPPSEPVTVAEVGGRRVAFVPRHGKDHRFPSHLVPYRANLWALRALGVTQVLGPCAVGSLRLSLRPGAVVVPDQLVDRTSGRAQTFYDSGAVHVSFADPYCPRGRRAVLDAAAGRAYDGGTMVIVEGPRFSTRAESRWYALQDWALVNMSGHPEAVLARELAMCYTAVALVTDVDAGVVTGQGVTQEQVFRVFADSLPRLRDLLVASLAALPRERSCSCPHALDGMTLPFVLPGAAG